MPYIPQRVLITGAAGGIGRCCAREFAQAGYNLVITDLDDVALAEAGRELRAIGASVRQRVVDVADRAQVEALASWVVDELGGLDILINNAGVGHMGELADTTLEVWERLISVNLLGPLYHIHAFLPHWKERGSGHIVNISSGQAFFQLPTWGAYAAVKLALGSVSELFDFELRKYGIKVTTLYPFLVDTGFYSDLAPETLAQRLSMKLQPHLSMSPESVAKIIYQAVISGKHVEMVSPINRIGKLVGAVPSISDRMRKLAARIITGPHGRAPRLQRADADRTGARNYGFRFDETMSGSYTPVARPDDERPLSFSIRARTPSVSRYLDDHTVAIRGTLEAPGLADSALLHGTMVIDPLGKHIIRYDFAFNGNDGQPYHFRGQKSLSLRRLKRTMTELPAEIRDASGTLVATSDTRFDLRSEWLRFISSWRPTLEQPEVAEPPPADALADGHATVA